MNNYHTKFLSVFLFISIWINVFTASLEGADLHAILVSDTTDDAIGESVGIDLVQMERQLNDISKYSGLRLKKTTLSGKDVLIKNLEMAINNLKVNSDDVVIFYMAAHGFRSYSKKSRWPNLYFSIEFKGVDMDHVFEALKSKKPRLLIALSDVCNSYLKDWELPPLAMLKRWPPAYLEKIKADNYKKLFLGSSGYIIATGSSKGQYSYCTENDGGLFTYSFLSTLKNSVEDQKGASWDFLFAQTQHSVMKAISTQIPDYEVQVQSVVK